MGRVLSLQLLSRSPSLPLLLLVAYSTRMKFRGLITHTHTHIHTPHTLREKEREKSKSVGLEV